MMRAREFPLYIVGFAAALLICGCGGPQGVAVPPPTRVLQPDFHGRNLLYVSGYFSTNVYTYPGGKFVSGLQGATGGLCSDASGDVFVTNDNYAEVDEYQHGQAVPIARLSYPLGTPRGCSVDPITGKLAVVGGGVAVYRPQSANRWHLPKLFETSEDLTACGFDGAGNLFVDGQTQTSATYLEELPKDGRSFEAVSLDVALTNPGNIEWDGTYLAVGDDGNTLIHRYLVSGAQGTQEGQLTLSGVSDIGQFWIQGNVLIGPDAVNAAVYFWKYPRGGTAIKTISMRLPAGATISVARAGESPLRR